MRKKSTFSKLTSILMALALILGQLAFMPQAQASTNPITVGGFSYPDNFNLPLAPVSVNGVTQNYQQSSTEHRWYFANQWWTPANGATNYVTGLTSAVMQSARYLVVEFSANVSGTVGVGIGVNNNWEPGQQASVTASSQRSVVIDLANISTKATAGTDSNGFRIFLFRLNGSTVTRAYLSNSRTAVNDTPSTGPVTIGGTSYPVNFTLPVASVTVNGIPQNYQHSSTEHRWYFANQWWTPADGATNYVTGLTSAVMQSARFLIIEFSANVSGTVGAGIGVNNNWEPGQQTSVTASSQRAVAIDLANVSTKATAGTDSNGFRIFLFRPNGSTVTRAYLSNSSGSGSTTAPSITTQPVNRSIAAGQNTTFSVVATGSPAPTYQWQVSANSGSTWSNAGGTGVSGATSATLTLTNVNAAMNNYRYRVNVTNSAGTVTSTARTLTVTAPAANYLIALTFDDGPNTSPNGTVGVLDVLNKYGAKGTFFVNANHFVTSSMTTTNFTFNTQTRAVLQRMINEGHTVENHSWSHRNFTTLTSAQGVEDINRTSAAIEAATGRRPKYFRAPFFAYGEGARNSPLPVIGAGLDTNDWDANVSPSGQAIANFLLNQSNIRNGSLHGGIVLMHDGPVSTQTARTVQALDIFIPQMQAMGYEFVTLDELFRRTGFTPRLYNGTANNIVRWSNSSNSAPR